MSNIPTAAICPNELEFSEGIESTKKICACASQLDCVAEITGVSFGSNVPQYIKDNILVNISERVLSITSNLTNENIMASQAAANLPIEPLFNYQVEVKYQLPLIKTQEAIDKVLAEHKEKLKNDEGIKGIEEVLGKLEKQFPSVIVPPAPIVIKDITNPMVVGTEISQTQINSMQKSFAKATDILKAIKQNYFRNDYKNVNNSNVIKYVNREFNKFKTIYNADILPTLVDMAKEEANIKISIINNVINTNINAVSYNNIPVPINFDEADRYIIKNNLTELNNILVNVYSNYVVEYDNGIVNTVINNVEEVNKCL